MSLQRSDSVTRIYVSDQPTPVLAVVVYVLGNPIVKRMYDTLLICVMLHYVIYVLNYLVQRFLDVISCHFAAGNEEYLPVIFIERTGQR